MLRITMPVKLIRALINRPKAVLMVRILFIEIFLIYIQIVDHFICIKINQVKKKQK